MTWLPLTDESYQREGGLPPSRLVNLFAEDAPSGPLPFKTQQGRAGNVRIPRGGLVSSASDGSGPIRGAFSRQGVFSGARFAVSATTLYRDGVSLGTVTGSDRVRWAASSNQLVLVANRRAYVYDGATFAQITDADLPEVVDVVFLAGRFVFMARNSSRFYWAEVSDAANVDALSFASAESLPDFNTGALVVADEMCVFGGDSVEFFQADSTAANTEVFQPAQGRRYSKGCLARDTIILVDNAAFFVGADRIVFRCVSEGPKRISDHGIEEALRHCADITACFAFAAIQDGHTFYVLTIPGVATHAFDVETQKWAIWSTHLRDTFRATCAYVSGGDTYLGDDTDGTIWKLTPGVHTDGDDPIERLVTGWLPVDEGRPRCNAVVVEMGRAPGNENAPGDDPVVELCFSDDGGNTFSRWRQASIGKMGEYRRRAAFRILGMMRAPGRLFMLRCSDPVWAVFVAINIDGDFS